MIGSFWNLCRACPSMPVDKLHSEYRSTYRWHEFTGNSRPEVVRRPPVPNQFDTPHFTTGPLHEPPLPRRKKCPELAYKSHEFVIGSEHFNGKQRNDVNNRARSDERGTPSRRSKSEGPPVIPNGRVYAIPKDVDGKGIGKSTAQPATLHELEPLVIADGYDKTATIEKQVTIIEKKTTSRPFSQALDQERVNHFITRKENFGFEEQKEKGADEIDNKHAHMNGGSKTGVFGEQWYKEVIELRKKADEYKNRGWGIEIDPDFHKKQKDLWDQVSKRSSLSALSLASSIHRPITKEEKDNENNKKSIPTKSLKATRVPGQWHSVDNKDEAYILPQRFTTIRHHLERTTGPDVEEGALLPSPTREKLMPAITKRESESQRGSPKKTATSRHGSPQKGSPQKGSPKKTIKARSQSVGPGAENESPKRQLRSVSTAPPQPKGGKKTPVSTPTSAVAVPTERKPRPSTLSTTTQSRSKSSSLPVNGSRAHSVPGQNHLNSQIDQSSSSSSNRRSISKRPKSSYGGVEPRSASNTTTPAGDTNLKTSLIASNCKTNLDKKLAENGDYERTYDGPISISSCSPTPLPDMSEPIVKSPPEPTRVKSPEQIIMKSPDPVNWTVPLDTGKTFTVTQNVKEGEIYPRPQSEIKATTPVEKPPPPPQSAPPEYSEQVKMEAWKHELKESNNLSSGTKSVSPNPIPGTAQRYDKPVPGSTLRCLEDPILEAVPSTSSGGVLEKARDTIDRFFGGNKEDNV
ncbi:hypothetical protein ACFFRR_000454 [Megaselia abdita]